MFGYIGWAEQTHHHNLAPRSFVTTHRADQSSLTKHSFSKLISKTLLERMYDAIRHVSRKQFVQCYRTKVAFSGPIILGVEWKSVTMEVVNYLNGVVT